MAARARAPLNVRVDNFREWEPEPDTPIGVILTHFFHLWREAEGGGRTNYTSAERLASYLPLDWEEWALFLLGELALDDEDFGPVLLDFPDYVHILIARWMYPSLLPHPFAAEVDIVNLHFPDPPADQAILVGQPVQVQSQPPSPPSPPITPPPALPTHGQEVDPVVDPFEPIHDPYGIHDHGYIDPLTMYLAPPSPPTATTPPPPQPPYRRTARISTLTSLGETFSFTYPLRVLPGAFEDTTSEEGSTSDSSSSSSSSGTYETGEGSGSESDWDSGSYDSDV